MNFASLSGIEFEYKGNDYKYIPETDILLIWVDGQGNGWQTLDYGDNLAWLLSKLAEVK